MPLFLHHGGPSAEMLTDGSSVPPASDARDRGRSQGLRSLVQGQAVTDVYFVGLRAMRV